MTNQATNNAPAPAAILAMYTMLGCLISFFAGREPGTLPENIVRELAPALTVISGFLVSYSCWDVLAVGLAKERCNAGKSYNDMPTQLPEEVYLAQRVQTNQVEQMPVFLVGTIGCSLLVNGTVAAILALLWCILRRMYAYTYRNAVGIPFKGMGLSAFTLPCYFLSNSMVMSVAVHSLRAMLLTSG